MGITEIYYLGLIPAIPAGMALAMRAANRPGVRESRRYSVGLGLMVALLWPIATPMFVIGVVLDLLRCGRLIDRFLEWMVAAVTRKWGGDA